MFRVVTVAREFGSGGGRIGHRVAEKLGWRLLDRTLVEGIAKSAQLDSELVRRYDERVDSWLHRVSRRSLWHGAIEGVAAVSDEAFLDAETMKALTRNLIKEAHSRGECVIVGRGAQCVLQDHKDVLHAFVYGPWRERVARVRERQPGVKDVEELIRSTDRERADYIRVYFGCNWNDPHLYHLLLSSALGEEAVAEIIIEAIHRGGGAQS